jgi:hypothetical protein
MVRLADTASLRAHAARFPPDAIPREGLSPLDALRLDRILSRPYEELTVDEVAQALTLVERNALGRLFAYVLPAALRRPPETDLVASDRLLEGLLRSHGEAAIADWEPEIERFLDRTLESRPLRGGDDPVDLWISPDALRLRALEAARRMAGVARARTRPAPTWGAAREGPFYARVALALLERYPGRALERLEAWEKAPEENASRAWVEVVFHANALGWGPCSAEAFGHLVSAERATRAHDLLLHERIDVAIGAAAILRLIAPGRAQGVRDRVEGLLAALDACESDRFVLPSSVRRLLDPA